jgi:hypothetical protein
MRLLSHHADRSRPNGGRLRPMSQLRTDSHLAGFPLRTSVGSAPRRSPARTYSAPAELEPPASDQSHCSRPWAAFHRTWAAAQTPSRPAPSHRIPWRSPQSDAMGRAGRTADGGPWKPSRRRHSESLPPHPGLACSAEHDRWPFSRNDGWHGQPRRQFPARP